MAQNRPLLSKEQERKIYQQILLHVISNETMADTLNSTDNIIATGTGKKVTLSAEDVPAVLADKGQIFQYRVLQDKDIDWPKTAKSIACTTSVLRAMPEVYSGLQNLPDNPLEDPQYQLKKQKIERAKSFAETLYGIISFERMLLMGVQNLLQPILKKLDPLTPTKLNQKEEKIIKECLAALTSQTYGPLINLLNEHSPTKIKATHHMNDKIKYNLILLEEIDTQLVRSISNGTTAQCELASTRAIEEKKQSYTDAIEEYKQGLSDLPNKSESDDITRTTVDRSYPNREFLTKQSKNENFIQLRQQIVEISPKADKQKLDIACDKLDIVTRIKTDEETDKRELKKSGQTVLAVAHAKGNSKNFNKNKMQDLTACVDGVANVIRDTCTPKNGNDYDSIFYNTHAKNTKDKAPLISKSFAGAMLCVGGLLLIGACVATVVVTHGALAPVCKPIVAMGISMIAAGGALLGLFGAYKGAMFAHRGELGYAMQDVKHEAKKIRHKI